MKCVFQQLLQYIDYRTGLSIGEKKGVVLIVVVFGVVVVFLVTVPHLLYYYYNSCWTIIITIG